MGERMTVAERIAVNVQIDMFSGCHVYTGRSDADGYGLITVGRKTRRVHRVTWELANGPIPAMHVIDHKLANRPVAPGPCRYRNCCNPDHLEAVTVQENCYRVRPWNVAKTHCPKGHEYTDDNTRMEWRTNSRGQTTSRRHCRACARVHRAEGMAA